VRVAEFPVARIVDAPIGAWSAIRADFAVVAITPATLAAAHVSRGTLGVVVALIELSIQHRRFAGCRSIAPPVSRETLPGLVGRLSGWQN
jgi:hypothetical protein